MAEIKSTLDLVMERTRHLSLSDEEKAAQQWEAFAKRLQGLLQQYADEALDLEGFQKERRTLEAEYGTHDPDLVRQAVAARIDPAGDNRRWLDLLASLAPQILPAVKTLLADHDQQRTAIEAEAMMRSTRQLLQQHAISGPAVVPNPEKDPSYRKQRDHLDTRTRKQINEILRRPQEQDG